MQTGSRTTTGHAPEAAPLATWELDFMTQQFHWSPELYRICGVSPETFTLTMASAMDFTHPDDRGWVLASVAAAIQTGKDYRYECRLVRADGVERRVSFTGQVIKDPDGLTVKLRGTATDVSG